MTFDVLHVSGKEAVLKADRPMGDAVKDAQQFARMRGHRYAVVEHDTFQAHAIVWPDGGVDFLKPPQEL